MVFRAQDERLPRQVALKILSPRLAADDEFRHRFIRESRSAAAVDDPHIIPVYEAGDANGVLFIAMRYVPSGDAGTLVRRLGPLPIARVAAIISAVASALDAAHAVGLVHRDVKPANMLVDSRPGRPDHVYLSDFGLTKGGQASATQTGTGHFLGTPTYCAPEQIRGQPVDARADEYALACAAFMLLSGEPPFLRDEGLAVLYAHMSELPPRLTSRRQDLPVAVDDVLLRALAKTPDDRYLTCGEFADDLRAASGLQRYDSDVAVVLHQRALTDQQRKLGLDQADALASRASLAAARQEASRSDEAVVLHQQTLSDQRRALGPEHPDTLTTRYSLAQEMSARGEHTAAEGEPGPCSDPGADARAGASGHAGHPVQHRRRSPRAGRTPGRGRVPDRAGARQRARPDHPTRATVLRARCRPRRHDAAETDAVLAAAARCRDHRHAGDVRVAQRWRRAAITRAENGFRRVLAARQRTLGPDHPTRWPPGSASPRDGGRGEHAAAEGSSGTYCGAAADAGAGSPRHAGHLVQRRPEMAACGDHAGAEAEYRGMLPDLRRRLGADHPDTLATRFSIAQEMAARGDHAGAEDEFRAVLPHLERRLGRDHPDTLAARFGVAQEMAARGDHAGAREQFREVFAARQQALGLDHPDTLITWFSIAQEMAACGDHAGAEAEYRGMLPDLRRRPDHPDTLAPVQHRAGDGNARRPRRGGG